MLLTETRATLHRYFNTNGSFVTCEQLFRESADHIEKTFGNKQALALAQLRSRQRTYWLLLTTEDASICLTNPGFDLDVLVTADLAAYFQIWLGRLTFAAAQTAGKVQVDAIPAYANTFPHWFAYSLAAPAVQAALPA